MALVAMVKMEHMMGFLPLGRRFPRQSREKLPQRDCSVGLLFAKVVCFYWLMRFCICIAGQVLFVKGKKTKKRRRRRAMFIPAYHSTILKVTAKRCLMCFFLHRCAAFQVPGLKRCFVVVTRGSSFFFFLFFFLLADSAPHRCTHCSVSKKSKSS